MMKMKQNNRGFTLIETIVAISILMLGTIGPMTLAQRNLKASREAQDRLIASFLAQEAIEVVRNNIANNSADNEHWLKKIMGPPEGPPGPPTCEDASGCIVDITRANSAFLQPGQDILQRCNGVCTPRVYQDSGTFVYRQSSTGAPGGSWVETKFQRLVSVKVNASDSKIVTASTTVWWPTGHVNLEEDDYNWFFQIN